MPGNKRIAIVQDYLYILLVTINTIGEAIQRNWNPPELCIPGLSLYSSGKLSAVLPCTKIYREGDYASFPVPNELLDHPLTGGKQRAGDDGFELPSGFLASIRQVIKILVIAGKTDIGSVADAAGMSERSLQRHLRSKGTCHKYRKYKGPV